MAAADDLDRPLDPWLFFARRPRGYDAIPPVDCPCWRLTEPLAGEPLPDHVCHNTMAATVYHRDAPAGAELTADIAWPVAYVGDPLDGRGCPGGCPATGPARYLGLVVREWAEGEPSETFAAELAALARYPSREGHGWRLAESAARSECNRFRRRNPGGDVAAWVVDPASDGELRMAWDLHLRQAGVSPTPALLRHLRAIGADGRTRRDALPAKGLMVTTLVFVRTGGFDEFALFYDGTPEVHLAGPADLTTDSLWDAAGKVARRHRNWLREVFGAHPLADRKLAYSARKGAFQAGPRRHSEAHFDYLAEALANTDHLSASRCPDPRERSLRITKHLNRAYHRVKRRRERAGMDPSQPRGWRAEARRRLEA
jgi:hypothetical protein